VIGYVSLASANIVGKAIKMGSGGMGGRRYQIAAALLTYSAVSIAAIPIFISQIVKDKKAEKHTQVQHALPQSSAPAQPQAPAVNGSTISQHPKRKRPRSQRNRRWVSARLWDWQFL